MKLRYLALSFLGMAMGAVALVQSMPALAMKQIIIGGYPDALSNTATEYSAIEGGSIWFTSAASCTQVIPTAGTFSRLSVELSGVPGTNPYSITLMVNGNPTSLAVQIAAAGTTNINTDNTVDVVAGDYVYLRSSYTTAPDNTPTARWSIQFEGSTANESIVLGVGAAVKTATEYTPLTSGYASATTTENNTVQVIPTSGTLKKLYVRLSVDPGTNPDAYAIRLRVNGADSDNGSGNPLSVDIVADSTTGSDTTHNITVSAGNYVDITTIPANSPSASPTVYWGLVFAATTDGESLILGQSSDAPTITQTEYNMLATTYTYAVPWSTTIKYQGGQAPPGDMQLKKFYCLNHVAVAAAPDEWVITVMKTGDASTGIHVHFQNTAAGNVQNDSVDTYNAVSYDDLFIRAEPTDTPTAGKFAWGIVCFISTVVVDITVSPTSYNFGFVSTNASYTTANTSYFTIDNNSTTQTDQTISVTTSNWSGGVEWIHSDTATQGANQAGLLANRGGTWGVNDITIKYASPDFIYENCPAGTDYSFGLELLTPTSVTDGVQKSIVVRITAAAG